MVWMDAWTHGNRDIITVNAVESNMKRGFLLQPDLSHIHIQNPAYPARQPINITAVDARAKCR